MAAAAAAPAPAVTAPPAASAPINTATLVTPARCTADFSLVPIGGQTSSYAQQIADIQRLMQQSGLKYAMHSTGTTIEGPWDQVTQLIGWAHALIHGQGIARIQTDIRISTRTDKVQPMEGEIASVERILAA